MKRTIIATLLATSGAAYACGGKPCPTPSPAPSTPPSVAPLQSESASSSTSQSGAQAGSLAGAAASVSGLTVSSTGGESTATGSGSASLADNSRALALSLFVQPPAFTPPMAQVQCASASVKQEASSGWIILGGYSQANSHTDASDCTLIQIRNAMVKECKFASAQQVENLLVQKHLPKFTPTGTAYTKSQDDPGFVDYTPTQCAVLMSPPPPPPLVAIEKLMPPDLKWPPMPEKPPRISDTKPCGKGQKRNSKGVCYTPQPDPCKDVCKRPVGLI